MNIIKLHDANDDSLVYRVNADQLVYYCDHRAEDNSVSGALVYLGHDVYFDVKESCEDIDIQIINLRMARL